ncbi:MULTISPECIES: hypothetical protein [unclassified Streptomyces]|uniref:hypothetical protein n=1 Tax=unclassified Streptomyces TaxID=2593676 RepID=UPI00344F2EAB
MRFAFFGWLLHHINEFGYSHGALHGTVGTIALLLAAGVLGALLYRIDGIRRFHFAAPTIATVLFGAGVVWLMVN